MLCHDLHKYTFQSLIWFIGALKKLLPFSLKQNKYRIKQDFKIQGERHVFDVQQIEFQALNHLVYVGSVAVFDLSPGSDTGAYFEQVFIMWCTGYNLIDVKLPFGAWANQGHFPPQDVPELGQFVQAVFAHGGAPGCNPVVAILRQLWALVFRIGVHGAEFKNEKRFAIVSNPLLSVKNWAL